MSKNIQKQISVKTEDAKHAIIVSQRPRHHMLRMSRILLSVDALLLICFGFLAWWVHFNSILSIDITITRAFQENHALWLLDAMLFISYPGSSLLLPLLIFLTFAVFMIVGLRLEAIFVGVLSAVSSILNFLLKIFIGRPRPTANLVEIFTGETGKSFPSGHVMAYLAFGGLLILFGVVLFQGKRWWRLALLILPAVFVFLIGPSRVYLGDHWSSDVLGSYLIGGFLLGLSFWIYLALKERGVQEIQG